MNNKINSNAQKNHIAQCFNAGAATYDEWADIQVIAAEGVVRLLNNITPPRHILEIGCGTGLLAEHLIQRFPESHVVLTDIAMAMLQRCQQKFTSPHISFAAMDGEQLALQQPFDLIVSSMTYHWFTDCISSLAQLYAKVAPAGYLIFACLGQRSLLEWRDVCAELDIIVPTPDFPSAEEMQARCPALEMTVELVSQPYDHARHFLRTLKHIGAMATRANHQTLSSGLLRRAICQLDARFPQGLQLTYEIIYGCWRRST